MTLSFILCLSFAGWCNGNLPSPQPILELPPHDEEFHRQYLEVCRRSCAIIQSSIELLEMRLELFPSHLSPEREQELRQRLKDRRDELEKMKKIERELVRYEKERKLNPGVETDLKAIERLAKLQQELWPIPNVAPMPREVKPNP